MNSFIYLTLLLCLITLSHADFIKEMLHAGIDRHTNTIASEIPTKVIWKDSTTHELLWETDFNTILLQTIWHHNGKDMVVDQRLTVPVIKLPTCHTNNTSIDLVFDSQAYIMYHLEEAFAILHFEMEDTTFRGITTIASTRHSLNDGLQLTLDTHKYVFDTSHDSGNDTDTQTPCVKQIVPFGLTIPVMPF